MSEYVYAGLTSQTIDIFLQDSSSTTGAGLAGLAYNTAGLVASYRKGATGSRVAITLATQTVGGSYSSGGFVEIDATNMKGVYRLDIPNAAVDTEGFVTLYLYGATNLLPTALRIDCRALPVDIKKIGADTQSATDLKDFADAGYDPATNKVQGVVLVDTTTTLTNLPSITAGWLTAAGIAASALDGKGDWNIGKTGYTLTATTGLGNQTADITGSLSGSVGSVTGAVGSVTGLTAANLDVAVSSRLATASYTAPPSAGTISTQVASDLATAHGAGSWATATGFSTLSQADIRTAIGMATANLDTQIGLLATAANLLVVSDGVGFLTAVLMGACSDAGTAAETYVITFGGATYTTDYAGLDSTGNRGATTRTKT